ncbi:MAG: 2-C-methyl-D-erythritol 4-phosphate cytidylyltransferase [Muribaculaceae bacterium]|nr:2-C-methyl-D-erythritol 4-phosphate cytidylyltransferase [Muribaculaceae bacterium]
MEMVINIIVAAGSGSRFGSELPKQFCMLGERTVLDHAIEHIESALPGSTTVVVLSPEHLHRVNGRITAIGGSTRWESVKHALEATADMKADVITVHDGARPLPPADMIRRVTEACRTHQGAIPVIEVTDSLRRKDGTPVNRSEFRAVQTPQAFRADLLRHAYSLPYRPDFTDDASVMSAAGYTDIALVDGDPRNLKITRPADIEIAAIYLRK